MLENEESNLEGEEYGEYEESVVSMLEEIRDNTARIAESLESLGQAIANMAE